jgi:hypothetical protein
MVIASIEANSVEDLDKLIEEFYPNYKIINRTITKVDYKSEYKYTQTLVIEMPGKPLSSDEA